MYKTIYTNNLTEQQIFDEMQNFGKTILKNVYLLDNRITANINGLTFLEKLTKLKAIYNYNKNIIIKI